MAEDWYKAFRQEMMKGYFIKVFYKYIFIKLLNNYKNIYICINLLAIICNIVNSFKIIRLKKL